MCKNCNCGSHNIQPVTEQDLAQQFQVDTGWMPDQKPYEYKKWLEGKVLNQENHQNTIKACNDEIQKVIEDELNEK